jgi:hypothetical protein
MLKNMSEKQRDWYAKLSIQSCSFDCTAKYTDPFKWETVPVCCGNKPLKFRLPVPLLPSCNQELGVKLLKLCQRKGWKEYCCLHINYSHNEFEDEDDVSIPIQSNENSNAPLIHYYITDDPVLNRFAMGPIVEILQGRILKTKKKADKTYFCFKVALGEDEDPETRRLEIENNLKEKKLLKDDEHVEIRENDNNNN